MDDLMLIAVGAIGCVGMAVFLVSLAYVVGVELGHWIYPNG